MSDSKASPGVVEADARNGRTRHVGRRQGFSPYPKYKPSGVEWLKDVPEHWDIRPLKYSATLTMGQSPPGNAVQDSPAGLPFLQGCADFGSDHPVPAQYCLSFPSIAPSRSTLMSVRAPVGRLNVADQDYGIGRGLCAIQPGPRWHDRFAYWQLHILCDVLAMSATGSTYDAVSIGDIASLNLLLPLSAEQRAIAAYLDRETDKIDALIARNEVLIEHLKEQRAALISRMVTRGLPPDESRKAGIDPHPKLKPSGVEWLGDVPEHWDIRRLRHVCRLAYGDSLAFRDRDSGGSVLVYGSNGKVGVHSSANVCGPCLVIGRKGSYGKVSYSHLPIFAIDTTYYVDRRHTDADIRWLYYMLTSMHLDSLSKDSAIPGLNRQDAYARICLWPPLHEQRAIAAYLDRETAKIDKTTTLAQREADLLREYRSRVIADVVTGRVDVRCLGGTPRKPQYEPVRGRGVR